MSEQDAAFYAELYKKAGLKGGHVILLNGKDSPNYEATKAQALQALGKYPGGLQIGGGICPENAAEYLEAGASHVIVTSYVFKNGVISWENLEKIRDAAGKGHLVLDLSCRKKDGKYYIVTDRWQKFTEEIVTPELMEKMCIRDRRETGQELHQRSMYERCPSDPVYLQSVWCSHSCRGRSLLR